MTTIIYSSEDIKDAYAPSLNAAFRAVYEASGIAPRVVAPYGAWSSPAIDRAYGIKGRGPASDHYKGRAVDIANYAAIASAIGLSRLKAIMAAHGWRNVQVNGDDFSSEPWHYANHSSTPAGGAGIPIVEDEAPPKKKDTGEMRPINIWNTNKATVAYRGATIGEFTAEVQYRPTVPKARDRAGRMFGAALEVSQEEFDGYLSDVNVRRQQAGMQPLPAWPTAAISA